MHNYIELIIEFVKVIAWPLIVGGSLYYFKKDISTLFSRTKRLSIGSKGVEMVLDELDKKYQLSLIQRQELSGLTGNEVWALGDIAQKRFRHLIVEMTPAQKVVSRTLLDLGLVEIEGQSNSRKIVITELGKKFLEIANGLLD